MVDSSSFNLQPNFPVASIADLYANRPVKEAAIRAQQQQQLVQGLQQFGQGVDSLANRRQQVAQALAAAHLFAGTPSGQDALGTNQVGMAGQMPVIKNQTAAYDPGTGSLTPNKGPATMGDLQTAFMGVEPKDFLASMTAQKELSYKPQEIAIERRKALAAEENNRQDTAIKARQEAAMEEGNRIQNMLREMLDRSNIKHQANEDVNSLLARRDEATKNLSTGFFSSINNTKAKEAQRTINEVNRQLEANGYKVNGQELGKNEVIRTSPDGKRHVFDATTKKFLRDAA